MQHETNEGRQTKKQKETPEMNVKDALATIYTTLFP